MLIKIEIHALRSEKREHLERAFATIAEFLFANDSNAKVEFQLLTATGYFPFGKANEWDRIWAVGIADEAQHLKLETVSKTLK